jgi:hypothetical protein
MASLAAAHAIQQHLKVKAISLTHGSLACIDPAHAVA